MPVILKAVPWKICREYFPYSGSLAFYVVTMYDRIERVQRSLNTNFFGPLKITKATLPFLRDQGYGIVAFVGSMVSIRFRRLSFLFTYSWQGGWGGHPSASAYSVCKFALESEFNSFVSSMTG